MSALFAVTLLLSPIPVGYSVAQESVTVHGTVTDYLGRPLPGIVVYARSAGQEARVTANGRGRFVFLDLRPGDYRFTGDNPAYLTGCPRVTELHAGNEYNVTVYLYPDYAIVDCI